jgi:hypothetical protein
MQKEGSVSDYEDVQNQERDPYTLVSFSIRSKDLQPDDITAALGITL